MKFFKRKIGIALCLGMVLVNIGCSKDNVVDKSNVERILNVSYDPTSDLYTDYNEAFKNHWKNETGKTVEILQSHGGSGKQARSVIDGLNADVVTLALSYDINSLNKNKKLIDEDWQKRLPNNSTPYTSTIVFLVRKGNPKGIKDWGDLTRDGLNIITPNPKTSGGARWNYLAAWVYGEETNNGDKAKAKEFVKKLYKNSPVLDSGARASTTTFVERHLGDVLITWENEAYMAMKEFPEEEFEVIKPSVSILAEPPVSVVDSNVDKNNTRKVAEEYLKYLYSDEGQEIVAKHFYRPRNEKLLKEFEDKYGKLKLFTVDEKFGGWKSAQKEHFSDGGIFDEIYGK